MSDCCNRTKPPYHVPGYMGEVPGMKWESGNTFAKGTHELLLKNVVAPGAKGPNIGNVMYMYNKQ